MTPAVRAAAMYERRPVSRSHRTIRLISVAPLILGSALACEFGVDRIEENQASSASEVPDPEEIGYMQGDPDAPVVVVELSDFGCVHCATFALTTYPVILREYIEAGSVRWIYVPHFGGRFLNSDRAAEAAHCAGEQSPEHFQAMKVLLFETMLAWRRASDPEALLIALAASVETSPDGGGHIDAVPAVPLDMDQFRTCLESGSKRPALADARAIAVQRAVPGTPVFFVNGQMVVGSRSPDAFRPILDEALRTTQDSIR